MIEYQFERGAAEWKERRTGNGRQTV